MNDQASPADVQGDESRGGSPPETSPGSATPSSPSSTPSRLWNANFLLLWQGQLVSAIGDVAYEIALGFWILAVTGSTGLMGTLMASSVIPRVLLTPLAGVWADRGNRKAMLVGMDALRGAVVVLVAVAAFGRLDPGVDGLRRRSRDRTGRGGVQPHYPVDHPGHRAPGAPGAGQLLLLHDPGRLRHPRQLPRAACCMPCWGRRSCSWSTGCRTCFPQGRSCSSGCPGSKHAGPRTHFFADLKAGVRFVWGSAGLRSLMLVAAVFNFFAMIGIVLILPLFQRTEGLGPVRFGIFMAVFTGAMLLGMAFTAAVKISDTQRYPLFLLGMIVTSVAFALVPVWTVFPLMVALAALGGFANAIVNVLIMSLVQLSTPQDMRGKVMGFLEALTGGLVPIGMASGRAIGGGPPSASGYRLGLR